MGHLAMFDSASDPYCSQRKNTLFSVSGIFVALNNKGLSDSDSVKSPTSPLDFRVFSNLGSPFTSPRSLGNGHHNTWDFGKIGLSIVDSIADESSIPGKVEGKVLRSSVNKSILLGPQIRMNSPSSSIRFNSFEAPKSLPKNIAMFPSAHSKLSLQKGGTSNVVFEIGESSSDHEPLGKMRSCSLDSCRSYFAAPVLAGSPESLGFRVGSPPGSQKLGKILHKKWIISSTMLGSNNEVVEFPCASEIELSDEDYTCVISRGPNPKTTHIYGDRVLEGPNDVIKHCTMKEKDTSGLAPTAISPRYPSDNFLSFCYSCNKKLEGKDVYIYRGEKAFCSLSCRSEEILIDEEMEKTTGSSSSKPSTKTDDEENVLETNVFTSV